MGATSQAVRSNVAGTLRLAAPMIGRRVFLMSPAHCGGKRAAMLLRPEASFPLAEALRSPAGAPFGEVFAFLSGLYFRGKLAYSTRFAAPPPSLPGSLVITTDRGLLPPSIRVGPADLVGFARVPIDPRDARYREPLEASLRGLALRCPPDVGFVLLGSVGTSKYVDLLLRELGGRVWVPESFIGMGDMRRGSVMLRAAERGEELTYVPVPELARASRSRSSAGRS
jgi:hypothetical protein